MKRYLITDPQYYSNDPKIFKKSLQHAFEKHYPTFACYRNKELKNPSLQRELADIFLHCCQHYSVLAFINRDIQLGIELGFDGIHLTASQFNEISSVKKSNLQAIVSTHTYEEIQICEKSGADYVTYSPIFETPGKGTPVGIEGLKQMLEKSSLPIFALGGILCKEQIKQLQTLPVYGFASIRYFV